MPRVEARARRGCGLARLHAEPELSAIFIVGGAVHVHARCRRFRLFHFPLHSSVIVVV